MWLWNPCSWEGWEIAGLRWDPRRSAGTAHSSESDQGAVAELMRALRTWMMEKDEKLSGREIGDEKKQQKGERDGRKTKSERQLLNITANRLKEQGKKWKK